MNPSKRRFIAWLFLPTLFLFSSFLKAQNNQLNIFSPYGMEFTLHLDGDCKSKSPASFVRVQDLDKDKYEIKLEFKGKSAPDFKSTIYLSENGMQAAGREFNFSIVPYMGGGYTLQLTSITPTGTGAYGHTQGYPPAYPNTYPAYPGNVPSYPGTYPAGHNGYGNTYPGMREEEFEKAKKQVRFKAMDKDKLIVAKQVAATNFLQSQQVCALMKIFAYDSSKLEFAKFAYERTIDKGNFYIVNEAFSFNSTANQLNEFLVQR